MICSLHCNLAKLLSTQSSRVNVSLLKGCGQSCRLCRESQRLPRMQRAVQSECVQIVDDNAVTALSILAGFLCKDARVPCSLRGDTEICRADGAPAAGLNNNGNVKIPCF